MRRIVTFSHRRTLTKASAVGAAAAVPMLGASVAGATSADAPWSYSGATGPSHWGSLSPAYTSCADGTAQSPIKIRRPQPTPLKNLEFAYAAGETKVLNNGHTVEAEPRHDATPSTLELGHDVYTFTQFHFHSPSEHTIHGRRYPVDINKATADPAETVIDRLDWGKLLPARQRTVRYAGSLTTPGCSEGVRWSVMTHPITMSAMQIAAFKRAYTGNARPTQPLNGRAVRIDSTPSHQRASG